MGNRRYCDFYNELNPRQQTAVDVTQNSVVSAGAGSGKTSVIATRFAKLVVKDKIPVERILTLTFTNKATAEMKGRIYSTLKEIAENDDCDEIRMAAQVAIENFTNAAIMTFDSYCGKIAQKACFDYGIPPDFATDDGSVLTKKIEEAAKLFIFKHRSAKSMHFLLYNKSMEKLAEDLFVPVFSEKVSLTDKRNFSRDFENQKSHLWQAFSKSMKILEDNEVKIPANLPKTAEEFFSEEPSVPITDFLDTLPKPKKSANTEELCRSVDFLCRIVDFAHKAPILEDLFGILEEFRSEVNTLKRRNRLLSFSDVLDLAIEALKTNCDLRQEETEKFDKIMIDEFQDNNEKNRDLLFLLSQKKPADEITEKFRQKESLDEEKLFFVGDEKQSIYRFRGADVSVFRNLEKMFSPAINLEINYRSAPPLISAFNRIFGGCEEMTTVEDCKNPPPIQPGRSIFRCGENLPDYEASYFPLQAKTADKDGNPIIPDFSLPKVHFHQFDEASNYRDEAEFIGEKISEIMAQNPGTAFSDFAVLLRSSTHQNEIETALHRRKIPASFDKLKGFFVDAPVNDIYNVLRSAVYPADKKSFVAMLASPFVAMDKDEIFAFLQGEESCPKLDEARCLIKNIATLATTKTNAQLITHLWFNCGYFRLLRRNNPYRLSVYYDYLFEMARVSDEKGENLSVFVDSLSKKISDGQTLENPNIPTQTEDGVQIMSIHKSKGLQFKNVFIPYCSAKSDSDKDLVFFDETFGLTLNLPLHPTVEKKCDTRRNYFRQRRDGEIKAQDEAELRRMLYVAMTRAEKEIFVSYGGKNTGNSFQSLLSPILGTDESICFEIKTENASPTATEETPVFGKYRCPTYTLKSRNQNHFTHVNASSEEAKVLVTPLLSPLAIPEPAENLPQKNDALLDESSKLGFTHDKFGTLVHLLIEIAMKNGGVLTSPQEFSAENRLAYHKLISPLSSEKLRKNLLAQAASFAENFLKSPLCAQILSLPTEKVKSEFSFRLFLPQGQKPVFVKGTFDLLAEFPDFVQIVDFKTDLNPHSSHHFTQMAIYKTAGEALLGKPAKVSLFFVRSPDGEEKIFP